MQLVLYKRVLRLQSIALDLVISNLLAIYGFKNLHRCTYAAENELHIYHSALFTRLYLPVLVHNNRARLQARLEPVYG